MSDTFTCLSVSLSVVIGGQVAAQWSEGSSPCSSTAEV